MSSFVDKHTPKITVPKFGDVLEAVTIRRQETVGKMANPDTDRELFADQIEKMAGFHSAEAHHVMVAYLRQIGAGDRSLDYHQHDGGSYKVALANQLAEEQGGQPRDYDEQARRLVQQTDEVVKSMVPSLQRTPG